MRHVVELLHAIKTAAERAGSAGDPTDASMPEAPAHLPLADEIPGFASEPPIMSSQTRAVLDEWSPVSLDDDTDPLGRTLLEDADVTPIGYEVGLSFSDEPTPIFDKTVADFDVMRRNADRAEYEALDVSDDALAGAEDSRARADDSNESNLTASKRDNHHTAHTLRLDASDSTESVLTDGTRTWSVDGVLHRVGAPAVLRPDGTCEWYHDGVRHREDGPAVEQGDFTLRWYQDGQLHREDGPAIEWEDGSVEYFVWGIRHRDDGPAIERSDGTTEWWRHGERAADESGAPSVIDAASLMSTDKRAEARRRLPEEQADSATHISNREARRRQRRKTRSPEPITDQLDPTSTTILEEHLRN